MIMRAILFAFLSLAFGSTAQAASEPVTCATIEAALAVAQGGDTFNLDGDCGSISIPHDYDSRVTINAGRSSVKTLVITGENIRWRSGVISALDGARGFARNGYGAWVGNGARNITFEGVRFTDARKGLVIDQAENVRISRSKFIQLGEDGIIASRVRNLTVTFNWFGETSKKPTECDAPGGIIYGLSSRDCRGQGFVWRDGGHPDALQMRNAVIRAYIAFNFVQGETQGLTQMDTTGDLPLEWIDMYRNVVITDDRHRLTLGRNCLNCTIRENTVLRYGDSSMKAVIIAGAATRCGNVEQDGRTQDAPCSVATDR